MSRTWSRWVPAVVVPAVIGVAVAATAQTGASAHLPDKSPAEVLAMMGGRTVEPFSGTYRQTSHLGLPALPEGTSSGSAAGDPNAADVLAMLTGTHTGRVFVGGPTTARVQVMDSFAERDLVRNGADVWAYDSADNTATHLTLPADHASSAGPTAGGTPTPEELADRLVKAMGPSTNLTVGQDTEVAGRAAYDLVLTPRAAQTLVGSVAIAVDGETGLPLGVTVRAHGQKAPAFEVTYTSLEVAAPDPGLFAFAPPRGATVVEHAVPAHGDQARDRTGASGAHEPSVIGSGWDAVVVMPADGKTLSAADGVPLDQLTTVVQGGRLLSTALVNVLVTNDGRVLAGSVPLERLQAAAAS
ncbi:hypothetical protein [Georgenia sp. SYP-B2076]|uniref:LolA family protein n=1 Tax=Georgenia sp. SYP-B2076 TaxID=2495881 RepID=UPI000F8EF700|nr:hypothetical protein [Georgenia sp. SYP-B2076]